MNIASSRSHSLFTITVERSEIGPMGRHIRVGKLNMVDLEGGERLNKTGAKGERLKEGTLINQSLSSLGNVITALSKAKGTYVPYRNSKLTILLQDSLGGNTKTVMIVNVGPADYNYDETLISLTYANKAKGILNRPKINQDPKVANMIPFFKEVYKFQSQLDSKLAIKFSEQQ